MKTLTLLILFSVCVMGQDRPDTSFHVKVTGYGYMINGKPIYMWRAQSSETIKQDSLQFGTFTEDKHYDNVTTFKPYYSTERGITDLILAYADECYADSILQHTYNSNWYDKCLRQTGNLAMGYSYVIDCEDSSHYSFVHREPTFKGFIEFLRKRMK